MKKEKLPTKFLYPMALVMLLDFTFTIIGQPSDYWNGFSKVNEGSPLGFSLLKASPIFFLLFNLLYLAVMVFLIKKLLPYFWGAILALSLFLGHVWGSSSWVYYLVVKKTGLQLSVMPWHWYLSVGYLVLISFVSVFFVLKRKR